MLLIFTNTGSLGDTPWCMVEIQSEGSAEPIVRRILDRVPDLFEDDPGQIFLPIAKLGMATCDLMVLRSHGPVRLRAQ